jgi:hypothetical protein
MNHNECSGMSGTGCSNHAYRGIHVLYAFSGVGGQNGIISSSSRTRETAKDFRQFLSLQPASVQDGFTAFSSPGFFVPSDFSSPRIFRPRTFRPRGLFVPLLKLTKMRNFRPCGFIVPFLKMADEEVLPRGFFVPSSYFHRFLFIAEQTKAEVK